MSATVQLTNQQLLQPFAHSQEPPMPGVLEARSHTPVMVTLRAMPLVTALRLIGQFLKFTMLISWIRMSCTQGVSTPATILPLYPLPAGPFGPAIMPAALLPAPCTWLA